MAASLINPSFVIFLFRHWRIEKCYAPSFKIALSMAIGINLIYFLKSETVHLIGFVLICNWVVCPNFGHTALTSSFTKYKFLHVKNSFATFLDEL